MKIKTFTIFVQHDNGIAKLKVKAMTKQIAMLMITMFEGCPESAILKINKA